METSMTADISFQKCLYCGNYHQYSPQMCRDMTIKPHPQRFTTAKEFEAAMDEAEDRSLAAMGMEGYAEGLIKEDQRRNNPLSGQIADKDL